MSTKALTRKVGALTKEYRRKVGANDPPVFKVYWGMDATSAEAIRAALCEIPLSEEEKTRFTGFWQQIADRLAWSSDFDRISLHSLTDFELDELHQWLTLMEERGAGLSYNFEASSEGPGYHVEWNVGLKVEE